VSSEDLRYARRLMDQRVAHEHRQASGRRLQELVRAGQSADTASPVNRLLRHSGLLLVALGGRLVRWALPPYTSAPAELGHKARD
jgi:hypothetical protein